MNRQGAANMLLLFKMQKYIDAANHLAHMYIGAANMKKIREILIIFILAAFLGLFK
jgi:hypothetical protein